MPAILPALEKLESVLCPICQADDGQVVYPSMRRTLSFLESEFRASGDAPLLDPVVRCRRCGMQYVNPRIPSDLGLLGYVSCADETFVSQAQGREITFQRSLRWLESLWRRPPGRLLDVGTANGSFLKVAQEAGWEVSGCEPNHWLRTWCQENYGISLLPGTLFDGNFPAGSFDWITLWDVLEHTPDPLAILKESERLLRPNGWVVINYPDIGSWIARVMGRKWIFLISVHNYYFTRETIRLLLKKVGLSPIRIRKHFQSLSLDYILFRAEPRLGRLARGLRRVARWCRVGGIQVPYWMGQTVVVAQREQEGIPHA